MDVLKDLLDNLTDSLIILDSCGQVVLFNKEAVRIQKSISEKPLEIGADFAGLVIEERREVVSDILLGLRRHKKPIKNFVETTTSLGANVFLEVSFVPVLGSRKELKYVNVITQDVTNRKLSERRIRKATADFDNLLEQAYAVIFSVDSRGYIVDWNTFCADLTGFSKAEVLSGRVCDILLNEQDTVTFLRLMDRILKNEVMGTCEFPMKTKSGGEVIVMLSATPRVNANGHVIGATLVGQDITEMAARRRALEKQVENQTVELQQVLKKEKEAIELKSRLASIASHEFRSPLSSIDVATSFIKQNAGTIGKKKLNEKVEVIEKHVNYVSNFLEDVLNYSKSELGRKLEHAEIALDDFVKEAVGEVTRVSKHSHHICVSTSNLGVLVTDGKLLKSIVVNLLTNAIRFSPGREKVSLQVLDEGDTVTIEVRDEGMGIPQDELVKIFEPFVRGEAAGSIAGAGLGLSITKKAVDLLQGTISVKSRPGKGSVFTAVIPRLPVHIEKATPTNPKKTETKTTR